MGHPNANPFEADRLRRRCEALIFGAIDMRIASRTAEWLLDLPPFEEQLWVRRSVETGLHVVYARPFIDSNGRSRLAPSSKLSAYLKAAHDRTIERRHQEYAHTDEQAYRMVIELKGADWQERLTEEGPAAFAETWNPPSSDDLADIHTLAAANFDSFAAEVERLRVRVSKSL